MEQGPPENKIPPNFPESKETVKTRVLLADDEEGVRKLAVRLLGMMEGYSVEAVENGKQLMDKLETGEYDLVITDKNMPEMDGMNVLANIRADARFEKLPVIVYSSDDSIKNAVEEVGATYLAKPFTFDKFKETVKNAVSKPEST